MEEVQKIITEVIHCIENDDIESALELLEDLQVNIANGFLTE